MNAPFSWPKSSLSSSVSGSAATLTAMNGRWRRGRERVEAARHQLLAGAALAQDEDGGVDGGDLDDALQHLFHRLRLADDAGDLAQLLALDQPAADQRDLVGVDGLGEALGEAQLAADLAAGGLRGLGKAHDGKPPTLARGGDQGARAALAQPAGDHHQQRLRERVGQPLAGGQQLHLVARSPRTPPAAVPRAPGRPW